MVFYFEIKKNMHLQFLEHIILPIGDLINSFFYKDLSFWRKIDVLSSEGLEQLKQNNLKKKFECPISLIEENYGDIAITGREKVKSCSCKSLRNNWLKILS